MEFEPISHRYCFNTDLMKRCLKFFLSEKYIFKLLSLLPQRFPGTTKLGRQIKDNIPSRKSTKFLIQNFIEFSNLDIVYL